MISPEQNQKKKTDLIDKFLGVAERYTWSFLFKSIYVALKKISIKIIKFNYILAIGNFFKRSILWSFETFENVKRKDHLWNKTKRRVFFRKVKHFLILIFCSYYTVSYFYDVFEHRNWLADSNDVHNKNLFTIKQWDDAMIEAFSRYEFYYQRMKLPDNIFDMWYHIAIFILLINILYFCSFFIRSLHEAFYNREVVSAMFVISGCILYQSNWLFGEMILGFFFFYSYIPFSILYFTCFMIHNFIAWRYDDEEEYLDSWINRYSGDLEQSNAFLDLPEIAEYDGNLHKVPNIYAVDPDEEVMLLIFERKRRHADVQPGGIYYELFKETFWGFDYDKDVVENIKMNITKTIKYFWLELTVEPLVETLHEFMHRYYKTVKVTLSQKPGEIITEMKEVIILPWNHKDRIKGKTHEQIYKFYFWTQDHVPLLIRWLYLFSWFWFEYRVTKQYMKKKKQYKRTKILFFWKNFKRFYGFKIEDDTRFFKFTDGYIIRVNGLPRVVLKNDFDFDVNLYNQEEEHYEPILIQIKDLIVNLFKNIIYFCTNFFGSYVFWWAVLRFWEKSSPTRIFFTWLFYKIILHGLYIIFEFFFISIPYRVYKTIEIFIYIIYSILKLYYTINILYWSFWLNVLYWIKVFFHAIFKKTRPVGPFRYYNASPWRRYKVEQFWKGFSLLFKRVPKAFPELNSKESFLVWSKPREEKKN